MQRPLIEPYDIDATTGGQTATSGGVYGYAGAYGSGQQAPNPIDAFFAGSRWRRDDVVFVLALLNLLFLLSSLWTAYQVTRQ